MKIAALCLFAALSVVVLRAMVDMSGGLFSDARHRRRPSLRRKLYWFRVLGLWEISIGLVLASVSGWADATSLIGLGSMVLFGTVVASRFMRIQQGPPGPREAPHA